MKSLYQVECISTHRMVYVCEAECAEYAMDSVVCNEGGNEIHQDHLGETIVCAREITTKEFKELCSTSTNGHCGEQLILKYE